MQWLDETKPGESWMGVKTGFTNDLQKQSTNKLKVTVIINPA